MMAKQDTVLELQDMLKSNRNTFTGTGANKLSEVNETFSKMAAKGVYKKKGLTLRGIEDLHLLHHRLNQPAN